MCPAKQFSEFWGLKNLMILHNSYYLKLFFLFFTWAHITNLKYTDQSIFNSRTMFPSLKPLIASNNHCYEFKN